MKWTAFGRINVLFLYVWILQNEFLGLEPCDTFQPYDFIILNSSWGTGAPGRWLCWLIWTSSSLRNFGESLPVLQDFNRSSQTEGTNKKAESSFLIHMTAFSPNSPVVLKPSFIMSWPHTHTHTHTYIYINKFLVSALKGSLLIGSSRSYTQNGFDTILLRLVLTYLSAFFKFKG